MTSAQSLIANSRFENKIKVIKMDVTSDEEVNNAYKQICDDLKLREEKLWAVINNAGISMIGPVDWGTFELYKNVFEVNIFGMARVSRTFLPLIRESRGNSF